MPVDLGEDFVALLRERDALQPRRRSQSGHFADGREQIDVTDQRVDHLAAAKAARPAQHQHHAGAVVGEMAFHPRERDAVIGGDDHQRVVGQPGLVKRIEHRAHGRVEAARRDGKVGEVAPDLRRVRQGRGHPDVTRIAQRRSVVVVPLHAGPGSVREEEPAREEERAVVRSLQKRCGLPADLAGLHAVVENFVAEFFRQFAGRFVLHAAERRFIPVRAEIIRQMPTVILNSAVRNLKWAWKLRVVWLMDSKSLRETAHPVGEVKNERFSHDKVSAGASALPVDTGGGRYHVQWDDSAPVTPLGQLVFFAQFLHVGG